MVVSGMIGETFGPYRVVDKLGEGGMGEVYRARDTTLGRDVALKVLPPEVAHDPDRVARFRREAQILAALNHPLIASIYGVDESRAPALVLELVEGPTLAERIQTGALPLAEALRIAHQIGQALEAAHQQGIAYESNESGQYEIYVRPFPGPGAGRRVSTSGGAQPRWQRNGSELFYISPESRLMSVPMEFPGRDTIRPGTAVPLFAARVTSTVHGGTAFEYDVSADGQRFLVNTMVERHTAPISLILNRRR